MSQQQPSDIEIIKAIFKSPTKTKSFIDSFKPALIGAIILVVLLLPFSTSFINSCGCESNVAIYAIKALVFVILFYIFGQQSKSNENEK